MVGGGGGHALTTQVNMLARLQMLLTFPTNSRSSRDSSTTRDGFSLHSARNWEFSTLPGQQEACEAVCAQDRPDPSLSDGENQQ